MNLIKKLQEIHAQKPKGFEGKKHSEETKRKISDTKRMQRMSDAEVQKRLEDYQQDDKSYGINSRLAKKWGITRQKAGAFIKKHNFCKIIAK